MSSRQPYAQNAYPPISQAYRPLIFPQEPQATASSSTAPPHPLAPPHINAASGSSTGSQPQAMFQAPAHKHAHHLHSIPPREKSTRTLIIDHMLWVHGRTRFAQARAELGMTDRTGGPSSPNYMHRKRPESYEEEDEQGSEGEETVALKARSKDPNHPDTDDEDERLSRQDLALARSLRVRAEGLEKVVISMLERPPPIHPTNEENVTSPKVANSHPHRLPNGVRLRLALGTIINDLFARQAPPPPYRHIHASSNAKVVATPSDHASSLPSLSDLPDSLSVLAPVSGAFVPPRPPPSAPSRTMQNTQFVDFSYHYPATNHMHMQYQPMHPQSHSFPASTPPPPPPAPRPRPSQRTRTLYAAGADPDTANSPPAFRCPRHLHTGCEICVEAKSPSRQTGSSNSRGRAASFGAGDRSGTNTWKAMPGGVGPGGGGITGWQDGSGIGSGLLRPGVRGSALRRKVREGDTTAGAGNTKLSKLIPRFLRLSALVAAELGREARGEEDMAGSEDGEDGEDEESNRASHGPSTTRGTPRREWAGGGGNSSPRPIPSSPLDSRGATARAQAAQRQMYENALRPSAEWYMLLAGLLTRAVLEGYLSAGWTGLQAVQCLMLVGFGVNENAGADRDSDSVYGDVDDEEDEQFANLDPDELPTLVDAIKILFPNLRGESVPKGKAEEEYEVEMLERLKRFYDIPASTPDCATHMEDVAWQYPAEPVERAAVRFCEAIQRWRGKPELETYKKKPEPRDPNPNPGGLTMDALVHSNPSSPALAHASAEGGEGSRKRRLRRPAIEVYFIQPAAETGAGPQAPERREGSWMPALQQGSTHVQGSSGVGQKRYRDANDEGREATKRLYV